MPLFYAMPPYIGPNILFCAIDDPFGTRKPMLLSNSWLHTFYNDFYKFERVKREPRIHFAVCFHFAERILLKSTTFPLDYNIAYANPICRITINIEKESKTETLPKIEAFFGKKFIWISLMLILILSVLIGYLIKFKPPSPSFFKYLKFTFKFPT